MTALVKVRCQGWGPLWLSFHPWCCGAWQEASLLSLPLVSLLSIEIRDKFSLVYMIAFQNQATRHSRHSDVWWERNDRSFLQMYTAEFTIKMSLKLELWNPDSWITIMYLSKLMRERSYPMELSLLPKKMTITSILVSRNLSVSRMWVGGRTWLSGLTSKWSRNLPLKDHDWQLSFMAFWELLPTSSTWILGGDS